ncbi:aminoglycoside adenylyltransferase domain-containing protein [Actinoplanes sp. NPDC051633]|uniref:aminoglycoside adenylyltransferase domain-containing protein n=1 Tax=Actinoplanes sp. NPDC051633 TaxID=3155670 RepID=UPI003413EDEE
MVEGLYLIGSAALDDFQPSASDVDFLAVTSEPPDNAAVAALGRAHARLRKHRKRPFFDGGYVTWSQLRHDPAEAAPGPTAHEGRLRPTPSAPGPVEWHTLAQAGVRCRGPEPAELGIWTNTDVLRRWVLRNLDDYWGKLRRAGDCLPTKYGVASLTPYATVWCATGLSRIHYTLATGEITSKAGGARYALTAFAPRWRRINSEALRIRCRSDRRSLYRTAIARRRDLLGFWDMLYDDAQCIGATLPPRC